MNNVNLIPQVQKAGSYFHRVTSRKSRHYGQKRGNLEWQYAGFEPNSPEAKAINSAIEAFGRKLLLENGENWNFQPTPENCNLQTLVERLEAERGGWSRVLTKVTLDAAGTYYFAAVIRLLSKDQAAATAGSRIIREKCKAAAGNPEVADAMIANIESLVNAVESSEDPEEMEALEEHAPVLEKLVELLAEYRSIRVDAAAL